MEELYDEHGGIFYLVASLLVLAIYLELLAPAVNEAENQYLKGFIKKELRIILTFPLILLVALGIIKLWSLARGTVPAYGIIDYLFLLILLYDDPFPVFPDEIQRSVMLKIICIGYFFCHLSLFLFIFGIFGPFKVDWRTVPPLNLSMEFLYLVDKNGEFKMVNMAHGYLTSFLFHYTPEWLLFGILFYVSQVELMSSFRASNWFVNWLWDRVYALLKYMGILE